MVYFYCKSNLDYLALKGNMFLHIMKGIHLFLVVYTRVHVTESGARPDKFGAPYRVLHIKFHAGSMFQGYHILLPGINSYFFPY